VDEQSGLNDVATNVGKIFEEQIKKSLPDYVKFRRLNDSAQSFGGTSNLRFSSNNPFDCFIWNSKQFRLYCLELKSKQGKSISFERTKNDKGDIHYHQIVGLNEWDKYAGTVCGFLIEFREIETTVFFHIRYFNELIEKLNKKSFSWGDLQKSGLPYFVIPQEKKRTRYLYNMDAFLSNNNDIA